MSVAISPPRREVSFSGLEEQMQGMRLVSQPSESPSSQIESVHPRVLAFFQEQREIGQQPAPTPLQKKYSDEIYRLADAGCISSVDSPDWRLREISVKSTEAIIDVFNRTLRTPMIAASRELLPRVPLQNLPEFLRENTLVRMGAKACPEMPQSERSRFAISSKGILNMVVPHTTLVDIAQRLRDSEHHVSDEVGAAFSHDIIDRTLNIFGKLYLPEQTALTSIERAKKAPVIMIHGQGSCSFLTGLSLRIAKKAGRNLIKSGQMNPHITSSLLERYFQETEEMSVDIHMKMRISEGDNFVGRCLSW